MECHWLRTTTPSPPPPQQLSRDIARYMSRDIPLSLDLQLIQQPIERANLVSLYTRCAMSCSGNPYPAKTLHGPSSCLILESYPVPPSGTPVAVDSRVYTHDTPATHIR